jgi:hypothetical protein
MKNFKIWIAGVAVFAMIFTSCSKEDSIIDPGEEKATLSFKTILKDLDPNRSESKQAESEYPECSDAAPYYVEIILSQGGVNIVGSEATPFRIDLAPGQLFTQYEDELELEPGVYSLDHFTVYDMNDNLIWVAPQSGSSMGGYITGSLPLAIDLNAGVKKYVDVGVICFDYRMVNEYGYLFFDLVPTQVINFCIFGNFCDENGRHYPAEFSVNVWAYENGQMGEPIHADVSNTVELNANGDYAGTSVCVTLPDAPGLDQYYVQITLLNSDAYGTITERVIREGVINDADVRGLFSDNSTVDYYHFVEGCGGTDFPNIFPTSSTPPVIDANTNIFIYFDSSGSMDSTLEPLQIMRNNLLKAALLPLYGNDEAAYEARVQVIQNTSERTFDFLNIQGNTPAGNVIALVFQDEAVVGYHSGFASWNVNSPRTNLFESDITTLRSRLSSFSSNYYRGVVFQVTNPSDAGANFKTFIKAVETGQGNYAGNYGLSDRTDIGYVYDVDDGNSAQYYQDLIIEALRDLGYDL